jgi:hypothetical protein
LMATKPDWPEPPHPWSGWRGRTVCRGCFPKPESYFPLLWRENVVEIFNGVSGEKICRIVINAS